MPEAGLGYGLFPQCEQSVLQAWLLLNKRPWETAWPTGDEISRPAFPKGFCDKLHRKGISRSPAVGTAESRMAWPLQWAGEASPRSCVYLSAIFTSRWSLLASEHKTTRSDEKAVPGVTAREEHALFFCLTASPIVCLCLTSDHFGSSPTDVSDVWMKVGCTWRENTGLEKDCVWC